MEDQVTYIDTKYHTRSPYKVELDQNCNATCSKRLNYCPKKVSTSAFILHPFCWLGPKIWALIPDDLKNVNSLATFKDKLKKFEFENCSRKLCNEYIYRA